MRLNVPIK